MTLNKVTAECQNDLAVTNRMGTMIIDGGSYKSINSTAIYNNRGGEMTIKGNPEVVAQNGVALCSASGVVKVEGGSFSGGNGSYSDSNWTSAESAVCNWKNSKMTITGGTFTGTDRADAIVNNGEMHIANATVDAKNGSALKNQDLGSGTHSASTEIISGTFKNSAKGIDLQSGSVVLKDAEFSGNGADIYLNTGKQITIEKTFNHNATVACADPTDGRQLTTATTGTDYQKNLNLTSADAGYLVGYKTADGKEYRCLSKKVGVTVSGLEDEDAIKAEEPAEFTVTLAHAGSTGNGILTFGDKNGEIEYQDETGAYQHMPESGLEIGLGDAAKNQYTFRITPKNAGEQKLTATVVRDAVELGSNTTNLTGTKTLSVTGGNVTVEKDGRTLNIVPVVTGDKKTYSIPEDNVKVTVTLDKTQIPEGMVFDIWTTGSFSLPSEQNYKAETITFTMRESVDIAAQYRDATIEDDGSTVLGTAAIIGTAVVGTMVLGYQAYSLGTEFAGYLMDLPYFPANRSALAVMLWEDAGKPMPESELLYPDVGQEEQDMDLQHAARWAMENDLIPDRNEEGPAPEEMKFYPDNAVSRIDVLKAWQKAQELKKNA